MNQGKTPFERLLAVHSFTLQRISPKTNAGDVITHTVRRGDALSAVEIEGVVALVKGGAAYRCRIAKGRYCYGATVDAAIEAALAGSLKPTGAKSC